MAVVVLAATTNGGAQGVRAPSTPAACNPCGPRPQPGFSVLAYGGRLARPKCLDTGPLPQVAGSPVFISDCNGTASQQVEVEEINERHEVVLHAGDQVLGMRPHLTPGGALPLEVRLELQEKADPSLPIAGGPRSEDQSFALDGDSIILAADRTQVVKVQNARGANQTPLVVGPRDLADSELWEFRSQDGADRDPTLGFVRVGYPGDSIDPRQHLMRLIPPFGDSREPEARFGIVVKIAPDVSIDLSGLNPLQIPPGVTIRGDRGRTLLGPEIFSTDQPGAGMLEIKGDDVRLTGLRLRGPNTAHSTNGDQPGSTGVFVRRVARAILDHDDLSDFANASIVVAPEREGEDQSTCSDQVDPNTRAWDARVARNFIHHNLAQETGYGVATSDGLFPLIEGNTFVSNRHAIAASGSPGTGYRAWSDLVLSAAPIQHHLFLVQDFDMHGTDAGNNFMGGIGGDYVEVAWSTFLFPGRTFLGFDIHTRPNFNLRGASCHREQFHNNVSLESFGDSVRCQFCELMASRYPFLPNLGARLFNVFIRTSSNQFEASNPTDHLAVGDFDGDGVPDLFLATGAAWYYSPGGVAEWRLLSSGRTDNIENLRFGDFDGDGRTDVLGKNGRDLMVSWGGASSWERINSTSAPMTDLAVGDFDGDGLADIFWASGRSWWLSSGGRGPFLLSATSSFRVRDLRFGDFDGDGQTDVFGSVNGQWSISTSATGAWSPLRPALTASVAGLVVADFDGDGRADVATSTPVYGPPGSILGWRWRYSRDAALGWSDLHFDKVPLAAAAGIGRFSGTTRADVLLWNSDAQCGSSVSTAHLCKLAGGTGAGVLHSRQDMR